MPKFSLLALVLLCLGCSPRVVPLPEPPAELPGGWKLAQPSVPVTPPPLVAQYGVQRHFAALYAGPSELKVTFYEMPGDSSPFELNQKWRPAPGTLFFHQGRYFVTVESPGIKYARLSPIINALQQMLTAAQK